MKNTSSEEREGKRMIYFAEWKDNDLTWATAFINKDGSFEDLTSQENVIQCARWIGQAFYGKGRGASQNTETGFSANAFIDNAIENKNPGFRFFLNFGNNGWSDKIRESIKHNPKPGNQSILLACFVAHCMIQQLDSNQKNRGCRQPSELQYLVGSLLYSYGTSRSLIETFSLFRISVCPSLLERREAVGIAKFMEDYVNASPGAYDLHTYCTDNLDFSLKSGFGIHMENWVIQTIKVTKADDPLLKLCYSGKLDSTSKTLDELIEENDDAYTHIFGMREVDLNKLAFYRLCHIEYIIKHPFPTIDSVFSHLMLPPRRNLGIDVHPQTKYDENGKRHDFKLRRFNPEILPDDYFPVDCDRQNMIQRNGLLVDLPAKINMGEKETVRRYLDQHIQIRAEQIKDIKDGDPIPLASKYVLFVADGSPVYLGHIMKDEDALSERNKYKAIRIFPGAFHYMKEVVTLSGKLMEVFRRSVMKDYRGTSAEQENVLFPKDPRNFEDEAVPYVSAKYRAVIEDYAEFAKTTEFSAVDVHEFMIEEAKQKWPSFIEMNDIILHEIYFMFRDAVRANDSELFFSAVRLSLPLTAVTNAYHYIRIGFELLLWRAKASDEEVYLFEMLAFTRETETGKYQAVDLCQEKVNAHFRQKVGRTVQLGHDRAMMTTAHKLNTQQSAGDARDAVKGDGWGRQRVVRPIFNESRAGKSWFTVFAAVRKYVDERRLWKRNKAALVGSRGKLKEAPVDLVTSPNGALMSNEIITWLPTGVDRCNQYYAAFYEDEETRHAVTREQSYSKGGVPTAKISTTEKEYKLFCDRRVKLASSTSSTEIMKASLRRKEPIKEEIRNTCCHLFDDMPSYVNLEDLPDRVDDLADLLAKLRRDWIAEKEANGEGTKSRLLKGLSEAERRRESVTTRKNREVIIDNVSFFYEIDRDTKHEFSTPVNLCTAETTTP